MAAQEAMLTYRDGKDSETTREIVVEISGDVYGLDSEEVGRAIYRNIQSLQSEGRIGAWR